MDMNKRSELRKQVEQILEDKLSDDEKEKFFDEIFDTALACEPPADEEERDRIPIMLEALLEELPVRQGMLIAFDLGRAYQYKKGEPPQIGSGEDNEA